MDFRCFFLLFIRQINSIFAMQITFFVMDLSWKQLRKKGTIIYEDEKMNLHLFEEICLTQCNLWNCKICILLKQSKMSEQQRINREEPVLERCIWWKEERYYDKRNTDRVEENNSNGFWHGGTIYRFVSHSRNSITAAACSFDILYPWRFGSNASWMVSDIITEQERPWRIFT